MYVTRSDLREVVRSVLNERFIENDQEYLEDTIDQILDAVEELDTESYDEDEE